VVGAGVVVVGAGVVVMGGGVVVVGAGVVVVGGGVVVVGAGVVVVGGGVVEVGAAAVVEVSSVLVQPLIPKLNTNARTSTTDAITSKLRFIIPPPNINFWYYKIQEEYTISLLHFYTSLFLSNSKILLGMSIIY
jgi:hypothetical protein